MQHQQHTSKAYTTSCADKSQKTGKQKSDNNFPGSKLKGAQLT